MSCFGLQLLQPSFVVVTEREMLSVLLSASSGALAREGRRLAEMTAHEGACGTEPLFDPAQNQVNCNVVRPPGTSSRWTAWSRAGLPALAVCYCEVNLVQTTGNTGPPDSATQARLACTRCALPQAMLSSASAVQPSRPTQAPGASPDESRPHCTGRASETDSDVPRWCEGDPWRRARPQGTLPFCSDEAEIDLSLIHI